MAYGNLALDTITTSTGQTFGASSASTMKNRIINGDMRIDQRNGGAAITIDGGTGYSVDRYWGEDSTAGSFTLQQSTNAPPGFSYSLKATVSSTATPTGTQISIFGQRIEGYNVADLAWGTANAKTVTISFWARSSIIGTLGGSVWNSSGGRSYAFSYTTTQADTWQYFSVTIPGDTTGTWLTDNSRGINVAFALAAGPSYSSTLNTWVGTQSLAPTTATNIMATNGATLYITGLQFEVGAAATTFDYRHYTTELQLCQRYYQVSTAGVYMYQWTTYYPGWRQGQMIMPTRMRAAPSVSYNFSADGGATDSGATGYVDTVLFSANSVGSYVYAANVKLSSEL
jgi:hypothetical protein